MGEGESMKERKRRKKKKKKKILLKPLRANIYLRMYIEIEE